MQCVGLGSFESFILLYQKYHDRRHHQEAFQMFLPHCKPSRKVTTIRTEYYIQYTQAGKVVALCYSFPYTKLSTDYTESNGGLVLL